MQFLVEHWEFIVGIFTMGVVFGLLKADIRSNSSELGNIATRHNEETKALHKRIDHLTRHTDKKWVEHDKVSEQRLEKLHTRISDLRSHTDEKIDDVKEIATEIRVKVASIDKHMNGGSK